MIRHYLSHAGKALARNKGYALINASGLVVGMLSALIIAKYIGGSLEMDSFHENKERIYAVSQEEFVHGNSQGARTTTYLGVADLLTQSGDIEAFTTYYQHVESLVIAGDAPAGTQSFRESRIFIADSSFFRIFTFPFVFGDEHTAFSAPNAIVINRCTSRKYFGDADPVGKAITVRVSWGAESTYQVAGVIDDIPELSRFDFDFLIRQSALNTAAYWDVPDYSVFILTNGNTQADVLAGNLNDALTRIPSLQAESKKVTVSLDALASPQLTTAEYIMVVVAVFIVVISWMNYINQVIAQSYWRTRQIGIMRSLGASNGTLRGLFIVESGLMCLGCLAIVIGIYFVLEAPLQTLTNGHLLPLVGDPTYTNIIFAGVFAAGVIFAASIQTVVLLPGRIASGIRDAFATRAGNLGVRKFLVTVQFSISAVLLISVFVISDQLAFMRDSDKGFNLNDMVVIKAPMAKDTTWRAKRRSLALFKERCAALPFVAGVTSSTTVPGEEYRNETYLRLQDGDAEALLHQIGIDEYFFSLYEVRFIAGSDFTPDAPAKNRSGIVLNKTAARALGIADFGNAIGTRIIAEEEEGEELILIGIVEDFHQTSLKHEVKPIAFRYNIIRGHCSVKVNMAAMRASGSSGGIDAIRDLWNESYPTASFDHYYLSDQFGLQDRADEHFAMMFRYFTIVSVVIACMGLFALSVVISTRRQKEVGVRKVFGASPADILATFMKGYLAPLSFSLLIGTPLAIIIMDRWLMNFAYRVNIGYGVVALAIGTLVTIFMLTVSYSTLKASVLNPVKVLGDR